MAYINLRLTISSFDLASQLEEIQFHNSDKPKTLFIYIVQETAKGGTNLPKGHIIFHSMIFSNRFDGTLCIFYDEHAAARNKHFPFN